MEGAALPAAVSAMLRLSAPKYFREKWVTTERYPPVFPGGIHRKARGWPWFSVEVTEVTGTDHW